MALSMPRMPSMPRMSSFFPRNINGTLGGGGGFANPDPTAEQKARIEDIRAQMRDLALLHRMDMDQAKHDFGRGRSELGQSMAERGLGLSGIRSGAEGRQLTDFVSASGRAEVEHLQKQDALRRALEIEKKKTYSSGGGGGGFPWGVFSGLS